MQFHTAANIQRLDSAVFTLSLRLNSQFPFLEKNIFSKFSKMKVMIISFLVACIVAMVLAQTGTNTGLSDTSGSSSSMGMGGNMRQMLLMAALGGKYNFTFSCHAIYF